jgi:hypothetical protein
MTAQKGGMIMVFINKDGTKSNASQLVDFVKTFTFEHNGWWTGSTKAVVKSTPKDIQLAYPRGDLSLTALITILRKIISKEELQSYTNEGFACHHREYTSGAEDVTVVEVQPSGWCHGVSAADAAVLAISKTVCEYHISMYGNVTMPLPKAACHGFRGMWNCCLSRKAAVAMLRANRDLADDESVKEVNSHSEAKWELC